MLNLKSQLFLRQFKILIKKDNLNHELLKLVAEKKNTLFLQSTIEDIEKAVNIFKIIIVF